MPESAFMAVLQKITAGSLTLGELIAAADDLGGKGRVDLSQQIYEIWIKFNAEHPQLYAVHFNLAALLTKSNVEDRAEAHLRAAIALNADFLPAYVNLGGVLERQGRIDDAIALWREGVDRLVPVTGDAVFHKSMMLKQIARVLIANHKGELAEAALVQCLELDGAQTDAIGQLIPIRQSHCQWPVVAPFGRLDRQALMRAVQPLTMAAHTDDPLLLLAAAWRYVKADVEEATSDPAADRRDARIDLTARRMKVGYVSSDLRDHAIGYLMAEMFELHDRSKLEVFAYFCGGPSEGALTPRIRDAVEHWVDIRGLDDNQAASRIAADQIDVLVDVNGLTKDARTAVFARRPAPIQVNWLGFPGPIGSPYHQYLIADPWIVPPENEIYYSEKVARLSCYQANDRKRVVAETRPTRSEVGLPDDAFVFCCFNGSQKITRFMFDRWLAILTHVPTSVLWLLESTPDTQERLSAYAAEQGVDRSRIVFAQKQQNAFHLARYPLADLFLDTAPYGAHTTASDSLWMGVPVLTLSGRSFASRVCGSLVRSAGLPDLVCLTAEEYVQRAIYLATHLEELQAYRRTLIMGRDTCDLFNMDKLIRELEGVYGDMCAAHARGETPEPDLRNLDHYLEAGIEGDHEAQELLTEPDYNGLYRSRLARRHRIRPIPADQRLWTQGEGGQALTNSPPATGGEADAASHPLIQLRDAYDAASSLICEPLTKESTAEIQAHRERSRGIVLDAPAGSEMAGWEKHYRLLVDAIDPDALSRCTTAAGPTEEITFLSSVGHALDWATIKEAADRTGAEAIFFAAADEHYVELYGRLYVESILRHSDVSSLVILHVIGAGDRLVTLARTIGVRDERFILTGDTFDASAVRTLCYDSPPKGLSDKPIAHFQSARFIRLGPILSALKRPVFVTDIDLLLQRGVVDLLQSSKSADLVLNQNSHSLNAGSRLTANLLLVNPTPNATLFVNFLRSYLEGMLARPEVTRWIDQFGLLMARQFITGRSKRVKIQYFDTNSDINNVIYKTFQDNPFRFLSLYHGFDITSLEHRKSQHTNSVAAE